MGSTQNKMSCGRSVTCNRRPHGRTRRRHGTSTPTAIASVKKRSSIGMPNPPPSLPVVRSTRVVYTNASGATTAALRPRGSQRCPRLPRCRSRSRPRSTYTPAPPTSSGPNMLHGQRTRSEHPPVSNFHVMTTHPVAPCSGANHQHLMQHGTHPRIQAHTGARKSNQVNRSVTLAHSGPSTHPANAPATSAAAQCSAPHGARHEPPTRLSSPGGAVPT